MCKCDRIWHQFRCLIRCVTKHHSLISSSDCLDLFIGHLIFFCLQCLVNPHRNITGLLINGSNHSTGIGVKSEFSSGITDLSYGISYNLLNIHICIGCNLTHDKYKSCCCTCLTCHTAHRILFHKRIQNRIRYLITHFIRMAFCY